MLINIFLFELRYRLNRPATYIYFGILFLLSFLFITTDVVQIGGSQGNVFRNSPYTINQTVLVLNLFAAMICSAIMGVPVYRDFENRFHEILFTTPITKMHYLLGRFLGSYVIAVLVMSGVLAGIMAGSAMPGLDHEQITTFHFNYYWQPFYSIILPNVLFMGALFFTIGTLTRNLFAIYVQGILFLILYLISDTLTGDIDNHLLASLVDPIGLRASNELTKFWTPAQRNEFIIPLQGYLLYNRIFWMIFGLLVFVIGYRFFSFSAHAISLRKKKVAEVNVDLVLHKLQLPATTQNFNFGTSLHQFRRMVNFESKLIFRSPMFLILVFLGIFSLTSNILSDTAMYGITTYPVMVKIIKVASENFSLFFIIIITFYTGELVWRERNNKINQITDALPIKNYTLMLAKFTAMLMILVLLNLLVIITCVGIQMASGFANYDLGTAIKFMFLEEFPSYVFIVMLAFFIHALVNNKFLGHTLVILTYIINIALEVNGYEHKLYQLGNMPGFALSDMNGFGHFMKAVQWIQLYWLLIGSVLILVAAHLWVRGTESSFKSRYKTGLNRFNLRSKFALSLLLVLSVTCGSFIYYTTTKLNLYLPKNERRVYLAAFERKYKKYEKTIQPRITSVNNQVDLFPDERKVKITGTWWLKNNAQKNVDTLIYNLSEAFYISNKQFTLSIPASAITSNDTLGFYMLKLQKSLVPGDSMQLNFSYEIAYTGFENEVTQTAVVNNGTFFNSDFFPSFGYNPNIEIAGSDDRKKENLPKRKRSYAITDSSRYNNTYIGNDADWITFETTVSTVENQIAIAPGYLLKEWKENGRRYFHYKMDAPILNFYAYLSADYQVKRDQWNDVKIEIYYQQGHEYNVDRMITSIKHSLAYFTKNFGPYQHKQARIIEFPAYASFAQSFPNTIPYSESIGFILNISDPETIDASYYVTSHEIAHQWWAHQVIGCPVDGMTVFSETMAQYSALMVMKAQFGKERMKKFLAYELEEYQSERGKESEKEQPLLLNQNQPYLHYNKGSVVMYALQDLIGEDKVNLAAQKFIEKYKFKGAPYPNALDFYSFIQAETPDSLKHTVDDLFIRITIFNNSCKKATVSETKDKKYLVTVEMELQKYYADSLGNEKQTELNDWIEVGAVDEKDNLLYSTKVKMNKNSMSFQFVMDKKPYKAGIDPLNQLIDKDGYDNLIKVN